VQVKLAELIIAVQGAQNRLANAEDLSEEELTELHEEYRNQADAASQALTNRREKKKSSAVGANKKPTVVTPKSRDPREK